ncbi:cation diffusion facilitator family transporter [Amycolatopsis acidiphila]|uniref:Cation diffusion facilitator family transporter n=1 Tax=Amycolatopsis acidiphila TaxID=715473 RepID=A0A558AGS0_9PSEU|nr:cation diffusion facilitator family transporter [Amycolatopsis acidiphila]TVT23453.1 cation diffusion facilitator family transporter [Amycolatopsis acidiphila]UIJ59909.1 cation diffusion facilitator family transporter [Amycolatopsis acidiphila]GHG62497.1 cation diffusion facilitator transporter [Amycolatopsis acidiphila]
MTERESPKGESTLTVVLAGAVNLAIAIMKAVAGAITGSGALLSEAAHSVADTFTEILLLTALRRSSKPADLVHPFGYGKERYFWSLLAAVSIFASGAMFSFYEGFSTVFGEPKEQSSPIVGYIVLAVAFVLEGTSWLQAMRQVRRESRQQKRSIPAYLRLVDDPAPKSVFFEDSAALVGLVLAFLGLLLHQLTGSALYDGLASILIGLLLAVVAWSLGLTNLRLLIGRQADPVVVRGIRQLLAGAPEIEAVVDLQTMLLGTDLILVCARVDFDDTLHASDVERACVRLAGEMQEAYSDVSEVFIEPVPRTDPELRAAVLARYGEAASRYGRAD